MINVTKFTVNPFGENTYIVWDETKECVVVDAGNSNQNENNAIVNFINENGLTLVMLINTHGHFDHVAGVECLKQQFSVPFALNSLDKDLLDEAHEAGARYRFNIPPLNIDIDLKDKQSVHFGNTDLKVLYTPGHSLGHVCFYEPKQKILLCGDLLFRESIGRSDLRGGDYQAIMHSIVDKLLPLGGEVTILPGHGPKSDIGHEVLYNPFITEYMNDEINPPIQDEY